MEVREYKSSVMFPIFSLITTQRPDVVVYYKKHSTEEACWLALDAKYRTSQKNLSDSFSSAFTYRQSLIDPEHNGFPIRMFFIGPQNIE